MTKAARNTAKEKTDSKQPPQERFLQKMKKEATPGASKQQLLDGKPIKIAFLKKTIKTRCGREEPECIILVTSDGNKVWIHRFSGKFTGMRDFLGEENAIPLKCLNGTRVELHGIQKAVFRHLRTALERPYNLETGRAVITMKAA